MSDKYQELREALADATPGPWYVVGDPWGAGDFVVAGNPDPHVGQYVCDTENFDGREPDNSVNDAAYIAAASPATISELLAERDALARDAARFRWLAAHCRSTAEHWGGRWSIVVEGPAPTRHDDEDAFDAAIDAAMEAGNE